MHSDNNPVGERDDCFETFDAVIVGAGFAGLYVLYRLRALGLRVRGFEAGSDVGGTWYWNRYPGARCDVESLEYSYSFSDALQQEWRWSLKYAEQPEILRYINHVADRFELRQHIRFNTRVLAQTYDEVRNLWKVDTDDGASVLARYCIMASGNLSTPRVPEFDGLDRFQGKWYHSARWPHADVDFSGQRVAVIGTGATGVQLVPKIAQQAKHLYVFQRTANFSVPARNAELDAQTERAHKARYPELRRIARQTAFGASRVSEPTHSALAVTAQEREARYEAVWKAGGAAYFLATFTDLMLNQDANDTAAEFVRRKIHEIVKNPATAELLAPKDHPIGTKRLCVDTEYYETFNRDNVTLLDVRRAPIRDITAAGVRTAEAEYAVDAIVFATGFDAVTGALREIDIRGRDGLRLADKWAHGPLTYLGLMVAEFPNMFIITGPGSPSVKSNMVCSIEQHVEWVSDCIAHLRSHGIGTIEPTQAAEAEWVAHVNSVANATLFPLAKSWYSGANIPGKPQVFMPYVGGLATYIKICEEVVADGYRGFALGGARTLDTALEERANAIAR